MILKFSVLLLFACSATCQNGLTIDWTGQSVNRPVASSTNGKKCNTVEGTVDLCKECYPCNNSAITALPPGTPVTKLVLYDNDCYGNEVCCVSHSFKPDFSARIGGDCGKPGVDRGTRLHNRDFEPREFPWMAFVYKNGQSKPLCAATLVDAYQTLVTAASCVAGLSGDDLSVSFKYKPSASDELVAVDSVILHEGFSRSRDDIALLRVSRAPAAAPACLPTAKPTVATHCTTVSSTQYWKLGMLVVKQEKCKNALNASPDQFCAGNPIFKETPVKGAGLYCEDEGNKGFYALSGISLGTGLFTSVYSYKQWIEEHRVDDR